MICPMQGTCAEKAKVDIEKLNSSKEKYDSFIDSIRDIIQEVTIMKSKYFLLPLLLLLASCGETPVTSTPDDKPSESSVVQVLDLQV